MYSLMIVDDSNIIRNRIERTVKGKEFEVVATAFDGSDACIGMRNCLGSGFQTGSCHACDTYGQGFQARTS